MHAEVSSNVETQEAILAAKAEVIEKLKTLSNWQTQETVATLSALAADVQALAKEFARVAGEEVPRDGFADDSTSFRKAQAAITEIVDAAKAAALVSHAEPEIPVIPDSLEFSVTQPKKSAWNEAFQQLNRDWGAKAHIVQQGNTYHLYINRDASVLKGQNRDQYQNQELSREALLLKGLQNEKPFSVSIHDGQIKLELPERSSASAKKHAISFALEAAIKHSDGEVLSFTKLPLSKDAQEALAAVLIKSNMRINALDLSSIAVKDKKALIQAIELKQFKHDSPNKQNDKAALLRKLGVAVKKLPNQEVESETPDAADAEEGCLRQPVRRGGGASSRRKPYQHASACRAKSSSV